MHAWWPCPRWADTLTGAARTLGCATEPDLDALDDRDQLAVIVLVGAAIRRAVRRIRLARPTTLTGDAVENGMVELLPVRDQLAGPDAVAAALTVGPLAGLGDTAWTWLTSAAPGHRDRLVDLARAVIDDWTDRAAQELAKTIASGQRVSITPLYLIDPPTPLSGSRSDTSAWTGRERALAVRSR